MAPKYDPPWYMKEGSPNAGTNRLTFGVEMEFLIGCLLDTTKPDPDPDDPRETYNIVTPVDE